LQVATSDELLRRGHRSECRCDVDATVVRRVGAEPARRFLELAFAARTSTAAGLVPGDCDVDEPLQEVSLLRRRLAPLVLELLVCGEELAGGDQLQALVESHEVRGRCGW
jgi:hypothetical protein